MDMKILKPEEIKQPRVGGLLHVEKQPKDWVLGAELPDINESGNWEDDIIEYELQRNGNFDEYACVTQAVINGEQCLAKHKYNQTIDWSKRYLAVNSGTTPGRGNSVSNVCESLRKKGTVLEIDYPTITDTMTQSEFYQPIPQSVKNKECFLKDWAFNHYYLNTSLQNGLKKSPIAVSVEGFYHFDSRGRVVWGGGQIAHEVLIIKKVGDTAYVLDSENKNGLVPFDANYKFAGAKILDVNLLKPLELNSNSMIEKATLIRSNETEKIYLLNSGGVKKWFPNMKVLTEIMGQPIVDAQAWNNIPEAECAMIPEGTAMSLPLSPALSAAIQALKDAFSAIGNRIKGK